MPNLVRKLLICAAADGLILLPLPSSKKEPRPSPSSPVRIRYGDGFISIAPRDSIPDTPKANSSFEAFGIVGLISVPPHSYLVSITRRQQVAQIHGSPVYVVTGIALTPCSSFQEADAAVTRTASDLPTENTEEQSTDDSSSEHDYNERRVEDGARSGDEDAVVDDEADPDIDPAKWAATTTPGAATRSSIVKDVIGRRGSYGRFAQHWFSRKGWALEQKRQMGLTDTTTTTEATKEDGPDAVGKTPAGGTAPDITNTQPGPDAVEEEDAAVPPAGGLLPKLIRTTEILLGSSRSFFFSYDQDITRSLANPGLPAAPLVPLHQRVDPMYFWNRHMLQDFLDIGVDAFALPLMQGFVGQRSFTADSHPPQVDDGAKESFELSNFTPSPAPGPASPTSERTSTELRPSIKQFDITLISRRSVKRAGLRYLRRGVDEEGFVANSVETEQILTPSTPGPASKAFSFVQFRGSIPLYFAQSPYSLRPPPVMLHSAEVNFDALKKHFGRLEEQYGSLQIVNLVEKSGVEAALGEAYESAVRRFNEGKATAPSGVGTKEGDNGEKNAQGGDEVPFEWFDFHSVCRGMKFENVSLLLQALGEKLNTFSSTVVVDGQITAQQAGVLRTNCMDCLDRTNVCQSSFAKHMLDLQLKDLGYDMSAQLDQETPWFNTIWADNGDAISKQYASTSAMKGDYTRFRKRDYRGALVDAGLSLTRFFNGMVNDFFLQATIDFLLGNVTSLVFEEFEANMMTQDPAVSMQRMREQAIDICKERVVADEAEELAGGWTMLTPPAADTVKAATPALEEAVLLLTDAALYLCRFDWNLDKVRSFERADLAHVQSIRLGTYVTSTISATQTDELRNVGLVIYYKPGSNDITRINTRSLSSLAAAASKSLEKSKSSRNPSAENNDNNKPEEQRSPSADVASSLAALLNRRPQALPPRKIALKALYTTTSLADRGPVPGGHDPGNNRRGSGLTQPGGAGAPARLTEMERMATVASEIERLAVRAQPLRFEGKAPEEKTLIEGGDIVSLAEARRSMGLLEQLGHSIKKLVWA